MHLFVVNKKNHLDLPYYLVEYNNWVKKTVISMNKKISRSQMAVKNLIKIRW